jgi:hypothetical protein
MVELLAAGKRSAKGSLIAQIALDPLNGQTLKILEVGSGTGQDADVNAGADKCAHNGTSDKTGRACDEGFHREDMKGET